MPALRPQTDDAARPAWLQAPARRECPWFANGRSVAFGCAPKSFLSLPAPSNGSFPRLFSIPVEFLDPLADPVQRLITRQVHMNRRDRYIAVSDGVKVCSRPVVLFAAGRSYPEKRPAARVLNPNHVFGPVAVSQPRAFKSAHVLPRDVGHVDIQNGVGRQRAPLQPVHKDVRRPASGLVMRGRIGIAGDRKSKRLNS